MREPGSLSGCLNGPLRASRVICKALEKVGVEVTVVDKHQYDPIALIEIEKSHDIVHTDNPTILTDQLKRGFVPDVVGASNWAPSKFYRDFEGGFYQYPGYEDRPDQLYDDAIWIRNNFQEEEFRPALLKKIRIIQPAVETEEIKPEASIPYADKRYILWAGNKERWEKNWHIMEKMISSVTLPSGLEWYVLEKYEEQQYLEILNQTALLIYTSKFESFGFQLFEAWAKAVPVIYSHNLWGKIGFSGCGGLGVSGITDTVEPYLSALHQFLSFDLPAREALGISSRKIVERDFNLDRLGRELMLVYVQAYQAKQAAPKMNIPSSENSEPSINNHQV